MLLAHSQERLNRRINMSLSDYARSIKARADHYIAIALGTFKPENNQGVDMKNHGNMWSPAPDNQIESESWWVATLGGMFIGVCIAWAVTL